MSFCSFSEPFWQIQFNSWIVGHDWNICVYLMFPFQNGTDLDSLIIEIEFDIFSGNFNGTNLQSIFFMNILNDLCKWNDKIKWWHHQCDPSSIQFNWFANFLYLFIFQIMLNCVLHNLDGSKLRIQRITSIRDSNKCTQTRENYREKCVCVYFFFWKKINWNENFQTQMRMCWTKTWKSLGIKVIWVKHRRLKIQISKTNKQLNQQQVSKQRENVWINVERK